MSRGWALEGRCEGKHGNGGEDVWRCWQLRCAAGDSRATDWQQTLPVYDRVSVMTMAATVLCRRVAQCLSMSTNVEGRV